MAVSELCGDFAIKRFFLPALAVSCVVAAPVAAREPCTNGTHFLGLICDNGTMDMARAEELFGPLKPVSGFHNIQDSRSQDTLASLDRTPLPGGGTDFVRNFSEFIDEFYEVLPDSFTLLDRGFLDGYLRYYRFDCDDLDAGCIPNSENVVEITREENRSLPPAGKFSSLTFATVPVGNVVVLEKPESSIDPNDYFFSTTLIGDEPSKLLVSQIRRPRWPIEPILEFLSPGAFPGYITEPVFSFNFQIGFGTFKRHH
ncbi:MAG: hypothetical protein AAGM21_05005 [Pseudomonadota bacterium]